jgi:shikimate kinase
MPLDGPDRRACRVILVGMMGSGKSTVGKLLSEATGWPYVDNDDLVLRVAGATPRELVAERGEPAMRQAESDALRMGLEEPPPCIVGAAAGTILDPANREAMRSTGIVAWLRVDAGALGSRAVGAAHRPWLEGDAASWLRRTVAERDPLYASVADVVVDTTHGAPGGAAQELRRDLEAFGACD